MNNTASKNDDKNSILTSCSDPEDNKPEPHRFWEVAVGVSEWSAEELEFLDEHPAYARLAGTIKETSERLQSRRPEYTPHWLLRLWNKIAETAGATKVVLVTSGLAMSFALLVFYLTPCKVTISEQKAPPSLAVERIQRLPAYYWNSSYFSRADGYDSTQIAVRIDDTYASNKAVPVF